MTLAKGRIYWSVSAVVIVTALLLYFLQEYRLYAKEAEHLWLNDWLWIKQQLNRPGAFAQICTSFLTQFFQFAFIGPIVLSLLFGFVFLLCRKIWEQFGISDSLISFWLLPLVFMFLCNENSYFNLTGHFAFALSLAFVLIYIRIRVASALALKINLILSPIIIVISYALSGSVALVTAVVVGLYELMKKKNWMGIVAPVLSFVFCAGISVRMKYFVDMEEAITPAQYYEWPSTYFFPLYAWISVPLLLVLGYLLNKDYSAKVRNFIFVGGIVVSALSFINMYGAVHNERVYQLRKEEWMARNMDWRGIIEAHKGKKEPTPFISYLNLALAEEGKLVQRMGEFNPYIVWSEDANMFSPVFMTNDENSRESLKLQSCIFMRWGGSALANAQKAAFEANLLTPGHTDPTELQRLIVTNSLFDTDRTALKYANRLARTTFYKDAYPSGEQLEELEDVLKRTLPADDSFYMKTQIGRMLRDIAYQTPDNKIATQFYEAYLIQSRDTTAYRHWKEYNQSL